MTRWRSYKGADTTTNGQDILIVWSAFNGYVIQNLYKPRIIPGKRIQTFRVFIDELCHDLVGSHRRALMPMSRRTSAGDEARLHNDPNIPLHLPEWVEGATRSNRCAVCSKSTSSPKEWIQWTKTCQSTLKLFTGANPVKCFCASLLATKTV